MLSQNRVRMSLVACTVLGMIAAASSASTVYAKSPTGGSMGGGSKSIGGFTGGVSKMGSAGSMTKAPKFDVSKVDTKLKLTDTKVGKIDPKFGKVDTTLKLTDPKFGKIDPKVGKIDPKLVKNDPKLGKIDPKLGLKDPKLALTDPKLKPIDPGKGNKPGKQPGNKKFPTPWCTPWWCGPHCPWPIFDFDCYCYEDFCYQDYCYVEPIIETVTVTVDPVLTLQFKNEEGATKVVGQFDPIVDRSGLTAAEAKLTSEGLSWWVTAGNGSVVESNIGT